MSGFWNGSTKIQEQEQFSQTNWYQDGTASRHSAFEPTETEASGPDLSFSHEGECWNESNEQSQME